MKNKKIIIKNCPSKKNCKYAVVNGYSLELKLDKALSEFPLPAKVKLAISACSMCCTMPKVRDVGLIATRKGWSLYFGGNGGNKPRIADLIRKNLTDDQAVALILKCLKIYQKNATKKVRTSTFLEKYTLDKFHKDLSNYS